MKEKLASAGLLFVIAATTTSCSSQNFNPFNSSSISRHPYDGLNRNSYGYISKMQVSPCGSSISGSGQGDIVWNIGHVISTVVEKPIEGQLVTDQKLIQLGLQDQFPTSNIGDLFNAKVVVLEYDPKGITFWYNFDGVRSIEIENAARKYCSRAGMMPFWNGSSRGCSSSLGTVNGQSIRATYAISDFTCKK